MTTTPARKRTGKKAANATAASKAAANKQPRPTHPEPKLRLFQTPAPDATINAPVDSELEPYTLATNGALPLIESLRQLSQDPRTQNCQHWGLMPYNLTQRTGFTGQQLQAAIQSQPDYDVYFCHAQPELEAVYHNPWMQAEANHPNFLMHAKEFLSAAGLPDKITDTVTHSAAFATGHMLIASPHFWDAYLRFIDQVLQTAQSQLNPLVSQALFSPPSQSLRPGQMSLLQLIVARLTSLFFMRKNQPWKICKLPTPQEAVLNPHLRLLREMKDAAIEQQSGWLTACWANYRALYLAQTAGPAWMSTHIRAINPSQLHLGAVPTQLHYRYATTTQARFQ